MFAVSNMFDTEKHSSSWLYECTTSARRALVESASSCKRGI